MNVLITGGAGFAGSHLAREFRRHYSGARIVAFDNLRRRGSELNLAVFREYGIEFVHGDIRNPSDLADLQGDFDLLIEASAEPSVRAGLDRSPDYVVQTNLLGTYHCLNFARRRCAAFVFLSTSRVYSIQPLQQIILEEGATRFQPADRQMLPGLTRNGIAESFPTNLARSLYGATKLSSEFLVQEFVEMYGLNAAIFRCGVIAGPGQFGKVDQGVFTMWAANHYFGLPLRYTGFGGAGKQVRDLLHPSDLFALIVQAQGAMDRLKGVPFNVGGGMPVSTSLLELTGICREVIGWSVPVYNSLETTRVDVPWYVSDCTQVSAALDWRPQRNLHTIIFEIYEWIRKNEIQLKPLFVH